MQPLFFHACGRGSAAESLRFALAPPPAALGVELDETYFIGIVRRGWELRPERTDLPDSWEESRWAGHIPRRTWSRQRDPSEELSVAAFVAAPKHFMLTKDSTDISEDIVKAAMTAAMSPYREDITLHAVGLGARGLSKDPYRSFCRLVESGNSNLTWRIKEHDSWASFLAWLGEFGVVDAGADQPLHEAPVVFGRLRGMEPELHSLAARAGGVAWRSPFPGEPLEQLRRWCRPAVAHGTEEVQRPLREEPEMEIRTPAPVEE